MATVYAYFYFLGTVTLTEWTRVRGGRSKITNNNVCYVLI